VEPGDVIVVLQQQKHQVFQRQSCDLMMTREISLTEALCGLAFIVRHLDGRKLVIESPPGMVIEPGNNCWMPVATYTGFFLHIFQSSCSDCVVIDHPVCK